MAAKYSRRPSHIESPPSPSIVPDMALLPQPLPSESVPCGQLVSKTSKLMPTTLEDRDYDDIGTRWYKDVICFDSASGLFKESFGGTHLLQKPLEAGTEAGTIEAEEQRVRLLKDTEGAMHKVWEDEQARAWLKEQSEAGIVVAVREVSNASYRRARLVDVGNGNWEVMRDVGAESKQGKRSDSGLDVNTNSKRDVVGVVVRKITLQGDSITLGEELGAQYWS
jgi:hypothetical protein